jgi:SAM-dependent methyltransferase
MTRPPAPPPAGPSRANTVARYYDRNTGRFLRFGGSRESVAIHRALWGPGVTDAEGAADYINGWIAEALAGQGAASPNAILDLGCGVGGTLFHLARAFPNARLHGVTLSPRQVEVARRLARERGLHDRCRFVQGDFHGLELGMEVDVAVAVESFVHATAPEPFLATAHRHLRPGGLLVVVDDFLARPRDALDARELRRVREFEAGWRLGSLCNVETLESAALDLGFRPVSRSDLTPLIRPGRPRDRIIALLAPLFRRAGLVSVPFFANMIGGNALQVGIRKGFLRYRVVILRKA